MKVIMMECTFMLYSQLHGKAAAGKLIKEGEFVPPTETTVAYLILNETK
jgi:hypothetical protein